MRRRTVMTRSPIACAIATRGRPHNIARQLAASERCGAVNVDFVLGIDYDELGLYAPVVPPTVRVIPTPTRMQCMEKCNLLATMLCNEYEIIGMPDDDHVPRSPRWDEAILEVIERRPGLVFPQDGHQGDGTPTVPFLPSEFVRQLGFFFPPGFVHLYGDAALREIYEEAGAITYVPEVLYEHMHPHAGKAEMDAQYEEANGPVMSHADSLQFDMYRASALRALHVATIAEVLQRFRCVT